MLSFPAAIKVYLCTVPCDMRRSFDGLSMMAEHIIRCNPFSGHLLVFCNRRTDCLKILYWDRDGWAIWYKQLNMQPVLIYLTAEWIGSISCRFGHGPPGHASFGTLFQLLIKCQFIYLIAFDPIAGVFYSEIQLPKIAF